MKKDQNKENRLQRDMYDFSGPRWEKYYRETRQNVRFPRGYKEVSLLQ